MFPPQIKHGRVAIFSQVCFTYLLVNMIGENEVVYDLTRSFCDKEKLFKK